MSPARAGSYRFRPTLSRRDADRHTQMRVGIHLPQYGHVAGPEAISRAARHAEELGFADIWVSDHIVHPAAQTYPSPHLYDPLVTLTWGAAVTTRVGLGTSTLCTKFVNTPFISDVESGRSATS